MTNAEYIKQLCVSYVRAVNMGVAADYWRFQLHKKLLERTWLNEDWLREVLHNLDVYVGYTEDPSKAEEYGRKLFELVKEKCKERVRNMVSSEKLVVEGGFESWEDWVEVWSEEMELDSSGCPWIKL